jgi:hypothetical protein
MVLDGMATRANGGDREDGALASREDRIGVKGKRPANGTRRKKHSAEETTSQEIERKRSNFYKPSQSYDLEFKRGERTRSRPDLGETC